MNVLIGFLLYLLMGSACAGMFISFANATNTELVFTDDEVFGFGVAFIFFWPVMLTAGGFYLLGRRIWK